MKYYNYDIVFQEVPQEVTLAVNITNCPNHCENCHSKHLWKDIGQVLDEEVLDSLISKYNQLITCVCLMGGNRDETSVTRLLKHVRQHTNLKTAWYSGQTTIPKNLEYFDYVKLGPYIPKMGGLNARTTNQRFYRVDNGEMKDITQVFWK